MAELRSEHQAVPAPPFSSRWVTQEHLGRRGLSWRELRSQDCTEVSSPGIYKKIHLSVHASLPFGKPMRGAQLTSLARPGAATSSLQCFPSCPAPPLTCHHACDGRRGIAALYTGGDVGWVSRQRGPHHLSPCKNTAKCHQVGHCGLLCLLSCSPGAQQAFPLPFPLSPESFSRPTSSPALLL